MADEKQTQQPEATSSEPAQKKPRAVKKVAASTEAPLVAPSASLAGPIETKAEEIPSTWDDAGEGLVFTRDDMKGAVVHKHERTLKHHSALPTGCWIQGPGATELLAEGIKLAQGASRAAGTPIKEIKAVYAMALPHKQAVLVKAVKEGTDGAIEASRTGKGPLRFNISDILREAEMEVTSGYREYYPVKKVTESPIGPCIAIMMTKSLKTRRVGEKEDEDEKK